MGLGPGADLAGRGSVGRGSPQDRGSVQVGGSRNMRTLIEVYKNAKPSRRGVGDESGPAECEKFAIVSFSEIVHQNSENVRYARRMSVTFSRSL